MKALKLTGVFLLTALLWWAFWIALTSFVMWHFTWPGDWDAVGRLIFALSGLFVCAGVTAGFADA